MSKVIGLLLAFMIVVILSLFAIGFQNSVPVPNASTTAGQQYANLTNATAIAYQGVNATLYIFIAVIVISGLFLFYTVLK